MAYQSNLETSWQGEMDSTGRGGEAELRLILVGKTGGGKSGTGNTLLGREEFESILRATATTLQCQKGQGNWNGWVVSVIDTPDVFSLGVSREILRREIRRCIELSRPGPHALVLVTQVGRFTAEDEAAVNHVLDVFGAEAVKHIIILFTRKEDLGGTPLQDYVCYSDNKALLKLVRECGNRVCAFNNRAGGAEREEQVSELMGMVQGVVQENRGRHYSNDLYSESCLTDKKIDSFVAKNKKARRKAEGARVLNCRWLLVLLGLLVIAILIVLLAVIFSKA